jgi:hypothetical protein
MPDPETTGPVNVVTPSGRTITVDRETAQSIVQQGGREQTGIEGDAAAQASAEAARYDNPVGAAFTGGLRSLTFGLSDHALTAMGAGGELEKTKEHNPGSSLVGEIGTALLPIGAPGAIARAAKAAGNVVRGTSTAGKVAATIVEGAVDGGAWNAAQQVSSAALTGDPLTPEKLASSIGMGALFGGAIGGGLGGVAAVSGAVRKKLATKANPLLNTRSQGAKDLGQHFGHAIREAEQGVDDIINRARDKRAAQILEQQDDRAREFGWDGYGASPERIEELRVMAAPQPKIPLMITNDMREQLRSFGITDDAVKQMTPQQAWNVINNGGPKASDQAGTAAGSGKRKQRPKDNFDVPADADPAPAQKVPHPDQVTQGGKHSVSDTVSEALPEGRAQGALAKDAAADAKLADKAARAEAKGAEQAGTVVDSVPAGSRPEARLPAKPGESAVAYAVRVADEEFAEMRNIGKSVRKNMVARFGEDMAIDFNTLARKPAAQALKSIQAIDDYVGWLQKSKTLGGDDLVDMQKIIIGRVQQQATGDVASAFNGLSNMDRAGVADILKVDIDKLPKFGPAAEHVLKAYSVARFADDISARAAVTSAEAKLAAVDSKAGGFLGGSIGSKLKTAAQAASLLTMAHPGQVLMRLASMAGKVSGDLAEGVDKFVQAVTHPKIRKTYGRAGVSIFNQVRFSEKEDLSEPRPAVRRIRELQELQGNPARLEAFIDDQLAPLRAHNQDLGYQVSDSLKARIGFIASKAPALSPPDPFTGWQAEPSKAELSEWARYIEAAEKGPVQLLEELQSGDLAKETVEAVKELYPGLFEKVQEMIIERALDAQKPMAYRDRLNLGQLFEVPIEPTAAPEIMYATQEMYAMQEERQKQEAASPRGTPKPPSMTKGQQFAS